MPALPAPKGSRSPYSSEEGKLKVSFLSVFPPAIGKNTEFPHTGYFLIPPYGTASHPLTEGITLLNL